MRYAVLSDVHANMEALTAVAESIASAGITTTVCLGDVVGYGPEPQAAVDAIRRMTKKAILGNHDRAVFTEGAEEPFNEWAEGAILWTREQLREDAVEFLRRLPLSRRLRGALLVHASPRKPSSWSYVMDADDAAREFAGFREKLCIVGHSHEPGFFEWDGAEARKICASAIVMDPDARYIVNAGSVGQPRDGDPRAAYAVVDTNELTAEIVRVGYDVDKTRKKILEAGLSPYLAERLIHGA